VREVVKEETLGAVNDEPVRYARQLRPGQQAELLILDVESGESVSVLKSSDLLFEAPNWHPHHDHLFVNGNGVLFRVDLGGDPELVEIPAIGLPELNNDHLIAPDGAHFYVSANDWHIYRLPIEGGQPERVTADKAPERIFRHFLHGVSPDGTKLAYVGTEDLDGDEWGRRALWEVELATGHEQLLGDGYSPADGPDYAPDGASVYFNSEFRSTRNGHAQIFRHDLVTGVVHQLTSDDRVNWFPHPSPNGDRIVYLSYPSGTVGHPADTPVELRLLDLVDAGPPKVLVRPFGGQGTINVPSWSPDGRRLAYVAYTDPRSTDE